MTGRRKILVSIIY